MGVEYYVSVAYGFADNDFPSRFPDQWDDWSEDAENGVQDWLEECEWGSLWALAGGNQWSGKDRWQIVIRSTMLRFSPRDANFSFKMLTTPKPSQVEQLVEAYNTLGIEGVDIGWMVMMDVL